MEATQKEKVIVAEHQYFGEHAGDYKFYEKGIPDKTIGYTKPYNLISFLDDLFISLPYAQRYDSCLVIEKDKQYTVEMGKDYEKEIAKEIIAKLLAINIGCDFDCAEDVVNECETMCTDHPSDADIQDIIMDYLGLDGSYAWIFK